MITRKYYKLIITSILIFTFFLLYNQYKLTSTKLPKKFDIIKNRESFRNDVLNKWKIEKSKYSALPIEDKCEKYAKSISKVDLKFWENLKIDPIVYNKRKWIKRKTREFQRKIKRKNWKPEIDTGIKNEFISKTIEYSKYENKMFNEFNDMKIGGKCSVTTNSKILRKLYPWYKSNPVFEGRGIVIPVLRDYKNIIRLIKSLRMVESGLPIEITHTSLTTTEQELIIDSAQNGTDPNLKQQISFVELSSLPKNDSIFLTTSSLVYSNFKEVILLSEDMIPLREPALLFNNERYQESGNYLFKSPSYLNSRVKLFTPGFHEITNFIKSFSPTKDDESFFSLNRREPFVTSRFYEDNFHTMIDPNIMVINRKKSFNGLLIASNLQFFDILKVRLTQGITLDVLWMGLEISGQKLTFNFNYPVMAGIYTPDDKLPKDVSVSQEICSASYGQLLDDDDITLIAITSYQLQNWFRHNHSFKTLFKDKYITKITESKKIFDNEENTLVKNDYHLLHKIYKNPLVLENIIKPPTLTQRVNVLNFNEPTEAWVEQKLPDHVKQSSWNYFCCYNVVGNPLKDGKSGLTININEELQDKYERIIDTWLNG